MCVFSLKTVPFMQYINESPQQCFQGSVCSTSKIILLKKIGQCLFSLQLRCVLQDRIGVWPWDESDYFHFCNFGENMQTLEHAESITCCLDSLEAENVSYPYANRLQFFSS